MLEGAIRSQINDGPVTTYEAGQSFSELPGDRHGVNANASETKPAKLLAVFVVDTNERPLGHDRCRVLVRIPDFFGRAAFQARRTPCGTVNIIRPSTW